MRLSAATDRDEAGAVATSVRALGALLDEALALAPISVVQVGLSLPDDEPLYSGVIARCVDRGVTVMAHSPLGGPERVARLLRTPVLGEVAARCGVSAASVALGGVLAVVTRAVA